MGDIKRYYLKIEGFMPVTLQAYVDAPNENDALISFEQNKFKLLGPPNFELGKLKKTKVSIIDHLSSLLKLVKNY